MNETKKITMAAARVNAGLTQRQAAAILGITQQTLCAWESGAHKMKPYERIALAAIYKVAEEQIFFN